MSFLALRLGWSEDLAAARKRQVLQQQIESAAYRQAGERIDIGRPGRFDLILRGLTVPPHQASRVSVSSVRAINIQLLALAVRNRP